MTSRARPARARPVRVGLFGLLGSGNIGNDGSLEAVLAFLRAEHPDAVLDAMCGGPRVVTARYGLPAVPLHWCRGEYRTASSVRAVAAKAFGKFVDAVRTAAWVRKHDVVIVPGMGVLEATLPLRPWGFPYSLLALCASGRLLGTKVALVCVGSNVIEARATRLVVTWAARLAAYRSYRDELSRDAMREMGVDTSADEVYPDIAFALPSPPEVPPAGGTAGGTVSGAIGGTVGVGVMAYRGGDGDRAQAEQLYRHYVDGMTRFVRWLVERGSEVRLFSGDNVDEPVLSEIVSSLGSPAVTAAPASSLDELMRQMAAVDTVVATRYHNVLCALKAGRPTLSVGYAAKNDALMADMGLAEFCHPARHIDVDRLISQFGELERRSEQLRETLAKRNLVATQRLERQFAVLSRTLFPFTAGGRSR